MSFTFNLTPLTTDALPTAPDALASAQTIIEAATTWKAGKKANGVQSYSTKIGADGAFGWHARVSRHQSTEVSFDDLWSTLSVNHYDKEVQYIKLLKRVEKLMDTPFGEAWALHYVFPSPVSPRVFTECLHVHLDDSNPSQRVGTIIQLPFSLVGSTEDAELLAKEGKSVKGRYASIEQVRELENGEIEWRMATISTPGGSLPNFITERSIPGEIINDVPSVINWIKQNINKE